MARAAVPAALLLVTAACWAYLFLLRAEMGATVSAFAMPMTASWTRSDFVLMWTMWAVMMAAMMIPSALPMVFAYARSVNGGTVSVNGSTPLFVAGYLVTWSGFALLAALAQWRLHDAALVNAMGVSRSPWLGGIILLGAGVYQFTPAKDACLGKCRTPLGFLLSEWREGNRGAFVMGSRHGTLCIGCCWALMGLLFVLGVMNLWWIVLVSTVVLIEKTTQSRALPKILGIGLGIWGATLLVGITSIGA